MSKIIYLNGNLSSRKSALPDTCESASPSAHSLLSTERYIGPELRQNSSCVQGLNTAKQAAKMFLEAIQTFSEYEKYLKSIPESLWEIDEKKKGKKTSWFERQKYCIKNGFGRNNSDMTAVLAALFSKSGGKTTDYVSIMKYGYLKDRFDWGKRPWITEEEIEKAIEEGSKESADVPEHAVEKKLQELYDSGTREILLEGNMGDYSLVQPYSGPCCAYSYAYGLSIVTRTPHNPMRYWNGTYASYLDHGVKDYQKANNNAGELCEAMYSDLQNGRPTLVHYGHSEDQHWIACVGIKEGRDPDNLTLSDFMFYDPAKGKILDWDNCYGQQKSFWGVVAFN